MKRVLVTDGRMLRTTRVAGARGIFSYQEFSGVDEAKAYLREYATDPMSMAELRRALAEEGIGREVSRMNDAEVIDHVAWSIELEHFEIAEELEEPLPETPEPEEAPATAPPAQPPSKKLTWIELQVVWDANGKPVKNVRLVVKTPDGEENYYDTNSEGLVRVDQIEPGTCDAYCDLKDATLKDTLGFVAKGEAAPKAGASPAVSASILRIAQVENKTAKQGESFDSIASGAAMTPKALARFNWNKDSGAVDAGDKLLVPRKWEESGLATGQRHIFRVKPLTNLHPVYIIEVEDLHFHHDSAVMLADYDNESMDPENPGKEHVTAISVLAETLREAGRNPQRKMLITGHTDTSGSAEYNLPLSQQRADGVLAALMGDRDKWVDVANKKHKVEDYQLILKWVSWDRQWECDPGKIDNTQGPQTEAATKEFQKQYNLEFGKSIGEDGIVGKETWGAFFDLYMSKLMQVLPAADEAELKQARSKILFVNDAKKAVGCGENFPKEKRGVDNWRSRKNRRVEILFFEPGELPRTACHTGATCNAAVCEIHDPKIFVPKVIPVPVHSEVGPLIVLEDAPAMEEAPPMEEAPAAAEDAPATTEEAPTTAESTPTAQAPTPKGAKEAPKPAPVFPDAPMAVLVPKPYTKVPRKKLTLKTDLPFDGTGTLDISGTTIKFFDALTAGNPVNTGGTFTGAKLTAGVPIYAEGVSASASVGDVVLKLTLTGGTSKVKPPAAVKMTAVEVILDICGERTSAKSEPAPLAQPPAAVPAPATVNTDKVYGGRFVQLQDAKNNAGRAMLIVRKLKPSGFKGQLILRSVDAKVAVFDKDDIAKGKAVTLPRTIDNKDIPSAGLNLWVQGAGASGALRDTGFALDLKDVGTDADKVTVTVVNFTQVKATIKSTPPNTPANSTAAGIALPADHTYTSTSPSDDFTVNTPLVLMQNGQPDVKLEVTCVPAKVPLRWQAIRNKLDHKSLGKEGDIPTVTQNADPAKVNLATLNCNQKGSFRIRCYIDTNATGTYDEKEPSIPLNLVLASATLFKDNSAGHGKPIVSSTISAGSVGISNGAWGSGSAPLTTAELAAAGMAMEIVADVTGGGADGTVGLDYVFAGLINQVATRDVVGTYRDPAVAPPVDKHLKFVAASNSASATGTLGTAPNTRPMFRPGDPAATLYTLPLLDTGSGTGTGGDSACMSSSYPHSFVARPVGQRWTIRCIDSPGMGFRKSHPVTATAILRQVHYNYRFTACFCFWTNTKKNRGATGDPADRTYSVLRIVNWAAVGDWDVTYPPPPGPPPPPLAPPPPPPPAPSLKETTTHQVSISGSTTVNPIGRAQDNSVEVRPPSGILIGAWDASA